MGATNPDTTPSFELAAIEGIGREPDQSRDLFAAHLPSSGNSAISVQAKTAPTPGMELSSRETMGESEATSVREPPRVPEADRASRCRRTPRARGAVGVRRWRRPARAGPAARSVPRSWRVDPSRGGGAAPDLSLHAHGRDGAGALRQPRPRQRARTPATARLAALWAPAFDEDYGLTVIEAMAWGAPLVVRQDGGSLAELESQTLSSSPTTWPLPVRRIAYDRAGPPLRRGPGGRRSSIASPGACGR